MTRTTAETAFIHGYMLVANTMAIEPLTLDDPTWDEVLDTHRHLFDTSTRYYEAHITVQPSGNIEYDEFVSHLVGEDWKCSDDVDHIEGMWFMSARHQSLSALAAMVDTTVLCLQEAGLTVLRHKIEDCVRDTKLGDPM